MSLLEFSQDKYCKTFAINESVRLGKFKTQSSGWLGVIRCHIYVQNIFEITGDENIQIKLYSDDKYQKLYAQSDIIYLDQLDIDLSKTDKPDYLGYLKFSFNEIHINHNKFYYPTATIADYTRSSNHVVGLLYDYPDPVYPNGSDLFYGHPIAMQIFLET